MFNSDTHKIYDDEGNVTNEAKEIVVGDKIWIGCRSTILKGAVILNNCVIGSL
jgi:acetyltransferase-like isoleucine patch superfamily enzyme